MPRRPLSLAFSGAHSTGKSTLINHFRQHYSDARLQIIEGIPRRLIAEGYRLGQDATQAAWIRYITKQFRAEREALITKPDVIISDRTVLDALGYARALRGDIRQEATEDFVDFLEEIWWAEQSRYDLVVYFPVEFLLVPDGIRDEDESFRAAVSDAIGEVLTRSEIKHIWVRGTIGERYSQVLGHLSEVRRTPSIGFRSNIPIRLKEPLETAREARTAVSLRPLWETENDLDIESHLSERGYGDILESLFLQRLKGVSFLGTLDVVYRVDRPSSRYAHSLAVGGLYLDLCQRLGLSKVATEALVISGLLHDAGHAPFSHNSEPFIAEAMKLYHQGLLASYVYKDWNLFEGRWTIRRILERRSAEVQKIVLDLLTKSDDQESQLRELFLSPINCDKVEGNSRSLGHLSQHQFDRDGILGALAVRDGEFFVRVSHLKWIEEFWRIEAKLYWDLIYTEKVFASEAMLTRALERTYRSEEVRELVVSTDEEVLERLECDAVARHLAGLLHRGEIYASLKSVDLPLWRKVEAMLGGARFDKASRKRTEQWLARELGCAPELVISHFSRRKQFRGGLRDTRQLGLFGDRGDFIPLSVLNQDLASAKVAGDFLGVFFPRV